LVVVVEYVAGDEELLEYVATRSIDAMSADQIVRIARVITATAAHNDALGPAVDRWLHVMYRRGSRHPEWLSVVVNTSIAAASHGRYEYARASLTEAAPIASRWEPPPEQDHIDTRTERTEELQQLLVGQSAWRRKRAQQRLRQPDSAIHFQADIDEADVPLEGEWDEGALGVTQTAAAQLLQLLEESRDRNLGVGHQGVVLDEQVARADELGHLGVADAGGEMGKQGVGDASGRIERAQSVNIDAGALEDLGGDLNPCHTLKVA